MTNSRPTEERRVVSVLFSDLAGFTERTEQSYLEDVRERLTVYHRAAREAVEAHGGRVEKLLGDGVFAVFGVPAAHEDDPERAVRAGLALQQVIRDLNEDDPELELTVRVAVTTGEALIQLDDEQDRESIVGDVVNTASRLEAVSPPGGVIVDERSYLSSRDAIDFEDLHPVDLRGKAEATAIWLAAGARASVEAAGAGSGPFVGRDRELETLVDARESTVASSFVRVVTVVGEPGAGKSRLLQEFAGTVELGSARWRQGRCLPYGKGITFWALGEIVKAEAGILESDSEPEAADKLSESVAALIDDPTRADWVRSTLNLLIGGTSEQQDTEPGELFSAWLSFFEAMARQRPLILSVEDIHWAEDALLDFLERIAKWDAAVPMLLIATARPELLERRADWPGEAVNLAALSDLHAGALLTGLLEDGALPDATTQQILERAGGNPLYITEFVRLVEDRGLLADESEIDEVVVPDSVQAVIAARLDLLGAAERELLQAASVVGKVFWLGAVAALRPGVRGIDELLHREMVRPVRDSSMLDEDEYAFTHALVRDVAYGQIARYDRAALHEASADWIEAAGRSIDVAELVAYHLGEALDLARRPEPALRDRAYGALVMAGERATGLDPVRASDYYRKAADAAQTDSDRADALLSAGRVVLSARADASLEPIQEAYELSKAAGDPEGQASALSDLAYLKWTGGDVRGALEQSDEAVRLIQDRPDSEAKARTLMLQARHLGVIQMYEEAVAAADRAAPVVYSVGTPGDQILLQIYRGNALAWLGDDEGIEELESAMRIADDRNFTHHMLVARLHLSGITVLMRSPVEAVGIAREAIQLAEERGLPLQVEWWRAVLAQFLAQTEHWDEALELCEWVIGEAAKHGPSWSTNVAHMLKGFILSLRGRLAEVQAIWDGLYEVGQQYGDPRLLMALAAAGAGLAEQAGNEEEALRHADEYHRYAVELQSTEMMPFVTLTLLNLGEADRIEALLNETPRGIGPTAALVRTQCEGHLAGARGDNATAAERFLEAVEIAERHEMFTSAMIARVQAAVALVGDERFDEIAATSRRELEQLGATMGLDMLDAAEAQAAEAAQA